MRTKTFLLVLFGSALTSVFCDTVRATSMAPAVTVNGASLVQLIDGKDKNDTVAIAPIPLPGALWLMASGLLGLAGFIRSRKARHS